MKNTYTTSATFVSKDGKTVRYQELFESAALFAEIQKGTGRMSAEDSEDLAQDAACKIITCSAGYDGTRSSPSTYASRVAYSCGVDIWHRNGRFVGARSLKAVDCGDDKAFLNPCFGKCIAERIDTERMIISRENVARIYDCIDALGEVDREIMIRTISGEKPRGIAKSLGSTPGAVSVRLHRARKVLRRNLDDLYREFGLGYEVVKGCQTRA